MSQTPEKGKQEPAPQAPDDIRKMTGEAMASFAFRMAEEDMDVPITNPLYED